MSMVNSLQNSIWLSKKYFKCTLDNIYLDVVKNTLDSWTP